MRKNFVPAMLAMGLVLSIATAGLFAKDGDDRNGFEFQPDSIVLSRTVFTEPSITIGQDLPLGCAGGATLSSNVTVPTTTTGVNDMIAVPCGDAVDNGEFPNLNDTHNVWNNSPTTTTNVTPSASNPAGVITMGDASFGISSQIFLDNLSHDGNLLGTLPIPTNVIVTSFSSKSELALNRSADGKSITFMGYQGGIGCGGTEVSPTAPGLLDVSASNTPGICDPTNPVITSFVSNPIVPTAYDRAVAEVDHDGHLVTTPGNAYSGDNGRAAFKASNGLYYMAGNDNSGKLGKKRLQTTPDGINLVNATGAELLTPGVIPASTPVPPNVGMIGRFNPLLIAGDKLGKETNFRGLTIFNNTLYVTKGSGGNGVNTVYQVGTAGTLPTGTAAFLATVPITILPGFPTAASLPTPTSTFPFGIWFADANTLYVCDEGDGVIVTPHTVNGLPNVADAASLATAGLQKWHFNGATWSMLYVLQDGLDIGLQYNVKNYPTTISPATGGCRNITGRHNDDRTVTIFAITSTISNNGDPGADPNKLVKVRDLVSATTLAAPDGDHDRDDRLGHFVTIRAAKAGEAFRGVALAPHDNDRDDKDHDHDDRLGHFVTIRAAKAGEAFRGVALAPHDNDRDDKDHDHDDHK